MSHDPGAGLRDLAQRVLDGVEIDWEHELRCNPEHGEAIRALREVEHVALAHRRAVRATTTGGTPLVGEDAPPAQWGPLRILERIGEGSYGEVFRAYDPRLQIEVALKLFRSVRPGATAALLAEARSLARVRHPNVLQVYGADEHDGRAGMWSELLRGGTLEEVAVRQGWLGPLEATPIGIDLCRALAAVHRAGLVHGDVKASNVMRALGGRFVLTDFGAAALLGDAGSAVGTPITMAPEQLQGQPGTQASDLYSLGALLYRLVTGQYPIEADSIEALRAAHHARATIPLRDRRPDLPAAFIQTVERAMAPHPEDRYLSAGEMERALVASLSRESRSEPAFDAARPSPVPSEVAVSAGEGSRLVRRRWIVAGAFLAALVGFAAFSMLVRPRAPVPPQKKSWVLVADFEGPADDPDLTIATRELVSAALDQSRNVASVPPDQIRMALEMAGKPAGTRVTPDLARELAYRSAVGSVVEGRVGRVGRGFAVVIRLVDADSARVILAESVVARNEDALIPALGRLVEKLRAGLGEHSSSIRAGLPIEQVATPSFQAYRLYVRAFYMELSFQHREARSLLGDALELDPDFAMAWSELAYVFANGGPPDSGLVAIREALRHPNRLTTLQRLTLEGDRSFFEGDHQGALRTYDRALGEDPTAAIPLINSSVALYQLGRFEESLERVLTFERAGPYGASVISRVDEVRDLICLGRADEARRAALQTPGISGVQLRTAAEILAGNWTTAESLAMGLAFDPRATDGQRLGGLLRLASAQAARGAFRAAAGNYERAGSLGRAPLSTLARLLLTVVSDGALSPPEGDSLHGESTAALAVRGLCAAIRGDRRGAERLLSRARADASQAATLRAPVALLEARAVALSGQWDEVIRILRPIASSPVRPALIGLPPSLSAARWLLADAFEELGERDSAAAWFEAITSDPAPVFEELAVRGIVSPFAHRRLVLLYSQMGRLEDARRHWRQFTAAVRTPDVELEPLVAETQAVLAAAQTARRPPRR